MDRRIRGASEANEPGTVAQLAQTSKLAHTVWAEWALQHGGRMLRTDVAGGCVEIGAAWLKDVPRLKETFEGAFAGLSPVSVGVGSTVRDADKALELVLKGGGGGIQLAAEDELSKADDTAGFQGPKHAKRMRHVSAWQQNFGQYMALHHPKKAPQAEGDSGSSDSSGFEGKFHGLASKASNASASESSGLSDSVKQRVLEILQYVKEQGPKLEELKASSPELYSGVQALVEAMIAMARDVETEQPVSKSEIEGGEGAQEPDSEFDLDQLVAGIKSEMAEHHLTAEQAKKIAKDHLLENPKYYTEHLSKSTTAAFRHSPTGRIYETGYAHDKTALPPAHELPRTELEEGFVHNGQFVARNDALKRNIIPKKFAKDEPSPLHNTVEGFMGGLKALPRGPARGRFITSHMGHAPFIAALQTHPQGKQIHGMLTGFLNSPANTQNLAPKVVVKSEQPCC